MLFCKINKTTVTKGKANLRLKNFEAVRCEFLNESSFKSERIIEIERMALSFSPSSVFFSMILFFLWFESH
ncbi:hypothetical protein THIOM_003883 [Candidatus Thiomargarita nelsonii]|uniref:Uncharacterized protein n=1 Tax=Candidatus Thiomargarita nelsonii TaxID=1003181 RepID=A0A176RX88_9GAMM|nr:hypothetical protein THIOM_003883 [Candidatus Thiomargarita nelsonii]